MNHELWIAVAVHLLALAAVFGALRQQVKNLESRLFEEILDRKKLEERVHDVELNQPRHFSAAG